MGLKSFFLHINPICLYFLFRRKARLRDSNFSLMASNCLGGIVMNLLGVRFNTPLVNIRIPSDDFVKFVLHYEDYLNMELQLVESSEPYPVAILGDIKLFFVHYQTQQEALEKWNTRKKRVIRDRMFFMLNDCDGLTETHMEALDRCEHLNIVVFTSRKYFGHRCVFYLPKFAGRRSVGNTMTRNWLTGKLVIEEYFDLVGWLNQEKGTNLESYRKK